MWYQCDIAEILDHDGVTWGDLDMCMHGLVDPVSKLPYKQGMALVHNYPGGTLQPLFLKCNQAVDKRACGKKLWSRVDRDALRFRTTSRGGPEWKNVIKRTTYNLDTNEVVARERVQGLTRKELYRPLPPSSTI